MDLRTIPAKERIITDYDKLCRLVTALREILHCRVVVTIGSWDMLHIGHVRYLMKAKAQGDILIVGVDSDRAIKLYKGPNRPMIPQDERMEMVSYQACVDLVTLIDDVDEKGTWQYGLIDCLNPDIFVAVTNSYPEDQIQAIGERCGEVGVLPPQAENTSTSKIIQNVTKGIVPQILELIKQQVEEGKIK